MKGHGDVARNRLVILHLYHAIMLHLVYAHACIFNVVRGVVRVIGTIGAAGSTLQYASKCFLL